MLLPLDWILGRRLTAAERSRRRVAVVLRQTGTGNSRLPFAWCDLDRDATTSGLCWSRDLVE